MATTLLTPGTTAEDSPEVALAEGRVGTVFMTRVGEEYMGAGEILILLKRANGTFTVSGYRLLGEKNQTDAIITGPCTFKVRRRESANAVGCDLA